MSSVDACPGSTIRIQPGIIVRRAAVALITTCTLAGFIGAVYGVVVLGVGAVLGSDAADLGLSVGATALIAVAFRPLHRWIQARANRLVHGRRASPFEVLAGISRRLASSEPGEGALTRMAQLMAHGTGAERTAVWLAGEVGWVVGVGWPQAPEVTEAESLEVLTGFVYPVVHGGEPVGALQVVKSRGGSIAPVERRLIIDLAGSAGLLLVNQRLTAALAARAEELRASRRRLLEAQDGERSRLERDLRHGARQEVVDLLRQLRLLEGAARRGGTGEIAESLSEIAEDAEAALDEVRSLAGGLYPPLLDSEGLEVAVASQVRRMPVLVEMRSDGVGRHSNEVELALYFAVSEALTNALKHGNPSHIAITLSRSDGHLTAQVHDDGRGFRPDAAAGGTGLINIRDRVEALSGDVDIESVVGAGTTVTARIPILERHPFPRLA